MSQSANPLKQFFRQPAIYMRLPSGGEYWPEGSIAMPENKELPVYPMTAIDEITYRTPDALFNGQAVINVIKSCVPSIIDPWAIPAQDLNAILVAIRIASYGHDLEVGTRCPKCETEGDYTLDLRQVLDQLKTGDFETPMVHGDLTITFQPMSYRSQNNSSQSQFEQQKNIQLIQSSDMPDEQKIAQLNESLQKITQLTMSALKWSISSIKTPAALVTEPEFIEEFIKNCDRKLYTKIRDHIISLRTASELKPLAIKCDNCSHEYQQQFNLDQTAFFRSRLLTASAEEIGAMVDKMDQEANAIRAQSLKMAWHMRGGATYEDVLQMSHSEREMLGDLIKENIETTNKTKLPWF